MYTYPLGGPLEVPPAMRVVRRIGRAIRPPLEVSPAIRAALMNRYAPQREPGWPADALQPLAGTDNPRMGPIKPEDTGAPSYDVAQLLGYDPAVGPPVPPPGAPQASVVGRTPGSLLEQLAGEVVSGRMTVEEAAKRYQAWRFGGAGQPTSLSRRINENLR